MIQPQRSNPIIEIDPFELARHLLVDNKGDISGEDYNYIFGSIRSKSHQNLSNLFRSMGPELRGVHESRLLAQIQALFKKNADFGTENARVASTWNLFQETESKCRIINRKFDFIQLWPERLKPERLDQMNRMKQVIRRVLGPLRDMYDALPGYVRVTDGATASAPRAFAAPERKTAKRRGWCYPGCIPLVKSLGSYYGIDIDPKPTNFNRIGMVPKQWDKHRLIAAEAEWALPIQLAVDSFLKDRLKKTLGIDLRNQTVNQEMAYEGSTKGTIGTIDLSAASDTIARSLVEYLLPSDWFNLLSSLRAPFWKYRGDTGAYAKFSSMGNGVTFCLETLIFYACAHACGAKILSVYGDDICVDTASYDGTVELLQFCGFTTNRKKSYNTGPFRESCGVDYHGGVDIRPYYLHSNKLDRKALANLVNGMGVFRTGDTLAAYLAGLVHKHNLPLIPTCDDATCGVFVTEGYSSRTVDWIPQSKILVAKTRVKPGQGLKGLRLWLFKNRPGVVRYEAIEFQTRRRTLRSVLVKWSNVMRRSHAPETYLWTSYLLKYLRGCAA